MKEDNGRYKATRRMRGMQPTSFSPLRAPLIAPYRSLLSSREKVARSAGSEGKEFKTAQTPTQPKGALFSRGERMNLPKFLRTSHTPHLPNTPHGRVQTG